MFADESVVVFRLQLLLLLDVNAPTSGTYTATTPSTVIIRNLPISGGSGVNHENQQTFTVWRIVHVQPTAHAAGLSGCGGSLFSNALTLHLLRVFQHLFQSLNFLWELIEVGVLQFLRQRHALHYVRLLRRGQAVPDGCGFGISGAFDASTLLLYSEAMRSCTSSTVLVFSGSSSSHAATLPRFFTGSGTNNSGAATGGGCGVGAR